MGIKISGLNELRERLERLHPEEVMAKALAEQAERMAARVREGLSEQPCGAGHDEPWLRSGALRGSVGVQAEGLQAAVGSNDPAAVPQELGTARMPARPFLAPVAAGMGEDVARSVGERVVAALRGEEDAGTGEAGIVQASATGTDLVQTLPLAALLALLYALGRNADPSRPDLTLNQPTIVETAPPDTEEDKKDAPPANAAKPREAKLSDRRRRHVLDGNEEGSGGHGPGRNTPNKDNFPSDWSDEKTIEAILDVANDPASTRVPAVRAKRLWKELEMG